MNFLWTKKFCLNWMLLTETHCVWLTYVLNIFPSSFAKLISKYWRHLNLALFMSVFTCLQSSSLPSLLAHRWVSWHAAATIGRAVNCVTCVHVCPREHAWDKQSRDTHKKKGSHSAARCQKLHRVPLSCELTTHQGKMLTKKILLKLISVRFQHSFTLCHSDFNVSCYGLIVSKHLLNLSHLSSFRRQWNQFNNHTGRVCSFLASFCLLRSNDLFCLFGWDSMFLRNCLNHVGGSLILWCF